MPPLNLSEEDVDDFVEAMHAAVQEARLNGNEEAEEVRLNLLAKGLMLQKQAADS